jgi:adenylate cyclase
MTHDVFISYSSLDKTAANTVCSVLEQKGISCWIAPRDITPGLDFSEAIIDGIKSSKLFILVYSSNSSNSKQVIREVDRAVHTGLLVINLRLEDVPLSKQLEYYLSSVHWLDAISPPLEEHINKLSGVVKILLRKDGSSDDDLEKAVRAGILRVGLDKKSIAVLPFKNLSNDPDQEYFSDGMMEEILDRLFKIGDLKVISRTSSMRYKNTGMSVKEIARELAVASIIEGSVRKMGNNVRIAVQLIDTGSDTHLWSDIYNADLSDLSRIFIIQSEVAQSVARELKAVLSPQELELIEKKPTNNIEAYDAYLKGQFYWKKFSAESLDTALQYFELAKEKDPDYALAYSGISDVWIGRQQLGFASPAEAGPKAMTALMKALELDPNLAQVHYSLALVRYTVEWDWEKSESEFKKAIEINPNYAEARGYYSHLLNITGHSEEALKQIELATKVDPFNPLIKVLYVVDLEFVRRFDDAINLNKEVLNLDPNNRIALWNFLRIYSFLGKYEETVKTFKVYFTNDKESLEILERANSEDGFFNAMVALGQLFEGRSQKEFIFPFFIAFFYTLAHKVDKTIDWLDRSYESRDPNAMYLLLPIFDFVRNRKRFQELAGKMKIPYQINYDI